MTTLVETRRALELLSMGNQQERRTSKRLAAPADFEEDGDFQFVRKTKRAKTEDPPAEQQQQQQQPPPKKTAGRGRPAKGRPPKEVRTVSAEIPEEDELEMVETAAPSRPQQSTKATKATKATTTTTTTRRSARRKASESAIPDEPVAKVQRTGTRRATRRESEDAAAALEEEVKEEARPEKAAATTTRTNGASAGRGRKKAKPTRTATAREREPELEPEPEPEPEPETVPVQEETVESAKISLPMSDTPIINRNKEMRKKGSNRRSSLGSRGRRASSLIESGQTAIPHREVNPAEFYKHIQEGLPETRRMKQLLTWCGERALAVKPAHGTKNSSIIHGARAIQDQMLKDFSLRSEFSDWFSRDEGPKAPVILKPNPRNIELDEKLAQLEANIARLQEEKKTWQAMRKLPPEEPPLYSEQETIQIVLPDFDLLDQDDGRIRGYLADEGNSFAALRTATEKRLQTIRSSLEFEVDQLADSIHKLDQRVAVAGKEAEKVLGLSAARLRERDERERKDAGTKDMPIMEVLRSLGSILPEGGG